MKNTKVLVITYGYFGDIAFASSLAFYLAKEYETVDYLIGFPQMRKLIMNNPYVNKVFVPSSPGPAPSTSTTFKLSYDKVIQLGPLSFSKPPVIEYKEQAGIKDRSPDYKLYTDPNLDSAVETLFTDLPEDKKVIAIMNNWEEKSYTFTKEQYSAGIDVPNLGYGGSHRNTDRIISVLSDYFTILTVGVEGSNQHNTVNIDDFDSKSILFEASIMKYCNAFIGAEGGLCNIAAGVGTKTIITGDFIHQLYGWNGVLKQIEEPKLGPKHYFNDIDHVTLDPYLTDDEVIEQIKSLV